MRKHCQIFKGITDVGDAFKKDQSIYKMSEYKTAKSALAKFYLTVIIGWKSRTCRIIDKLYQNWNERKFFNVCTKFFIVKNCSTKLKTVADFLHLLGLQRYGILKSSMTWFIKQNAFNGYTKQFKIVVRNVWKDLYRCHINQINYVKEGSGYHRISQSETESQTSRK